MNDPLAYLASLTNFERQPQVNAMRRIRLGRMVALLDRLGHPEQRLKILQVAGTKGKGSTAVFLYNALRVAGEPAGLFTSPHLTDVRERIRSADQLTEADWIAPEEFGAAVDRVRPHAEALAETFWGRPTYFEVVTALALEHFARRHLRWAVLEVGLGGRLDATTATTPLATLITTIGLDHQAILGATLAAIAREKAGVMKPAQHVFSHAQLPEAGSVLRSRARRVGARYHEAGREFVLERATASGRPETPFTVRGLLGSWPGLAISLWGRHQQANAATAVAAMDWLATQGVSITHEQLRRALHATRWPGRFEVMHRRPWLILDGAHTPEAAQAIAQTLDEFESAGPLRLIVGMSQGKDVSGFARVLAPRARSVVLTQAAHPRATPTAVLRQAFQPHTHALAESPIVAEAVQESLAAAAPEDVILVTGSLFVVGEARTAWTATPRDASALLTV